MKNVLTLLAILAMIGSFMMGLKVGKHECDRLTQYDTITYTIHDTLPILKVDTLYKCDTIIGKIDTVAVLKDYYSKYKYQLIKQDDKIKFDISTTITQNKPITYDIKYQILQPYKVNKNNIYIGVSMPIIGHNVNKNYPIIDILGTFTTKNNTKLYTGIGYQPYNNVGYIKLGYNIFSF